MANTWWIPRTISTAIPLFKTWRRCLSVAPNLSRRATRYRCRIPHLFRTGDSRTGKLLASNQICEIDLSRVLTDAVNRGPSIAVDRRRRRSHVVNNVRRCATVVDGSLSRLTASVWTLLQCNWSIWDLYLHMYLWCIGISHNGWQ